MTLAPRFVKRLLERHQKVEGTGCWEWTAARTGAGYGQLRLSKSYVETAHRLVYEHFIGPVPEGLDVCHECDNPPCINPEHLFLGTRQQNMADCKAKGRASPPPVRRGSDINTSKLCEAEVLHIRRKEMLQREYAALYDLSLTTVKRIQARKIWAWL